MICASKSYSRYLRREGRHVSEKKLRNDVNETLESRGLKEGEWGNRQVWKHRIGMQRQPLKPLWNKNVSGAYPAEEILHLPHH
jgi:hypothetical protein